MSAPSPANGTPHDRAAHAAPPPGPDASPKAPEGGRDSHGRFACGNRGGPGNPFARQVASLRCALLAAVSEQDVEAVAQELVRQAREGNLGAAKGAWSWGVPLVGGGACMGGPSVWEVGWDRDRAAMRRVCAGRVRCS